eukprot:TRINITY_DN28924_c0_g2_i1.p1 TRINITY_DN28924_c0_g2~~TRINITY_DN28924_c0_g2_i1.p1  ORF type:complete len:309 (-),score=31.08 TRINITY_DN28924_c0_g2_i1:18-944(-)
MATKVIPLVCTIFVHAVCAAKLQVEVLISGLKQPRSVACGGGKIYWADRDSRKIQRANLDGSDVEDIVEADFGVKSVAVDNDTIFWPVPSEQKIQSANLDGSSVGDVLTNTGAVSGIQLVSGRLYWFGDQKRIVSAAVNGEDVRDAANGANPCHIAVAGNRVFWTEWGLRSAVLDGGEATELVPTANTHGTGIAVNSIEGKVYWVYDHRSGQLRHGATETAGTDRLTRANFDGTNVEDIADFATDQTPYGMAFCGSSLIIADKTGAILSVSIPDNYNGTGVFAGRTVAPGPAAVAKFLPWVALVISLA